MTTINTSALENLEMFKTVFIETPVGTIEVIKGYDGVEAWIKSDNVPAHAVGVRASSPQRAFEHQLAVGIRYAPETEGVEIEPVEDLMQVAFRQTLQEELLYAGDEKAGARIHKAFFKAINEIETNKTIKFERNVLSFVSGTSGKQRHVTEFGCYKSCDCGGISYHCALYSILAAHARLAGANVVQFPAAMNKNGVVTEQCGCIYDWNDHFQVSFCPAHADAESGWSVGERFGWAAKP